MIPLSSRSRLAAAFLVTAAAVVLSCSFGVARAHAQSTTPADSAERARQVARDWALKIFDELGPRPNQDKRVTFQPLDERDVALSRHRRRLYSWMLSALHERGRVWKYSVMNPMDSRHVANALEQADVQDWSGVYLRTLRKYSLTKLNLSCDGIAEGNRIKLICTAQHIDTMEPWGRATAVFDAVSLGAPLAMEPALDAVAGEIVTGSGGGGRLGEIKIVDYRTEDRSALTKSIERSLEVKVVRRLSAGGRRYGAGTSYRLEGGVEHHDEKLVLRVKVHLNNDIVNAVEEHITLASVPNRLLQPRTGTPGRAEPGRGVGSPAKKHALHEAVQAGNINRVEELLAAGVDVNGLDGRSWTGLMHAASRGYTLAVASLLRAGAGPGIRAVDGATALKTLGRKRRAGEEFRACEADWCPRLVVVGAGEFMMGSPEGEESRGKDEGPRHGVRIGKAFAVGKYEVTRREYGEFVRETGRDMSGGCRVYDAGEGKWKSDGGRSWEDPGFEQGAQHPVVCVSWKDAKSYVKWLSGKTGKRYRLLSEAEWEYVARGGTTGPFHYGGTITTDQANYDGNYKYGSGSKGMYREKTVGVGSFPANDFGLHDVHGNVWEWVEDCWHENYKGAPTDGSAWERESGGDCRYRVLRGGSWSYAPRSLRSADRFRIFAGDRFYINGFRIARTLTP